MLVLLKKTEFECDNMMNKRYVSKHQFSDQLYNCNVYDDFYQPYDFLKKHQTPFVNIGKHKPVYLIIHEAIRVLNVQLK